MRTHHVLAVALASALTLAVESAAQAVITPGQPTERDVITARTEILSHCGTVAAQTMVSGSTIRTNFVFTNCVLGPGGVLLPVEATFGPLTAGDYTYEIYYRFETDPFTFLSSQPLVIAAVADPIPTANEWALIALGAILAVGGAWVLRASRF